MFGKIIYILKKAFEPKEKKKPKRGKKLETKNTEDGEEKKVTRVKSDMQQYRDTLSCEWFLANLHDDVYNLMDAIFSKWLKEELPEQQRGNRSRSSKPGSERPMFQQPWKALQRFDSKNSI